MTTTTQSLAADIAASIDKATAATPVHGSDDHWYIANPDGQSSIELHDLPGCLCYHLSVRDTHGSWTESGAARVVHHTDAATVQRRLIDWANGEVLG